MSEKVLNDISAYMENRVKKQTSTTTVESVKGNGFGFPSIIQEMHCFGNIFSSKDQETY